MSPGPVETPTTPAPGASVLPTTSSQVSAPTGRRYLQLVVVLGALIALGPLTIDMYLPAFPSLSADLNASDSATQLTLTGMLGGLAFGQLVIGPLSDAFGRKRPLMTGLLAHAVASMLAALAPTIYLLATVRVLQGFAGAAISVVAMAIVRDLFSGNAVARLMSRLMLVIGLAPILAPSIGGVILSWTSWRGIFGVLAGIAVLLTVVALVGLRETLPVERRRPANLTATLRTYRSLVRDSAFLALVFIGGLMMSAMFAYVSGSSFVLQDGYGLDEVTFGLVFGLNAAGLTVASQLNPLMIDRFGVVNVLSGAMLTGLLASSVLVTVGLTGVGGLPAVLVPLAVVVASVGLALPNTPALALTRHGEAAGTAAAVLGAVQFGVGAVVAPVVGLFGSTSPVPMAAVMVTVTALASVLMFGVVRRDPTVGLD
ncbi:MAG TPA: Bcr/CflA family multidrug efflux MFS transporter [Nocardioidaceae bacterium]|nr:Bcr/CflA family multidrug efflux MFS transporter [Nocardioidaceae bacterium]